MSDTPTGPMAAVLGLAAMLVVPACSSPPASPEMQRARTELLSNEVQETIAAFKSRDPSMQTFFDGAHGYAVYPTVTKGALVVGGAHGFGQVFEGGRLIGSTELTQGTIGLQIGGQSYSEVIFFKDAAALAVFKAGNLEFSGQASAVAARAGGSADADYSSGVLVFTATKGGLMLEASIGGQGFSFTPLPEEAPES